MSDMPAWLESLTTALAGHMATVETAVPLGLRYREADGVWDVLVYPLPVELVGGAEDGGVAAVPFTLDVRGVLAVFDRVDDVGWETHGAADDSHGPCLRVRGAVGGRALELRVLAEAPADVGPGMKVDATGRRAG